MNGIIRKVTANISRWKAPSCNEKYFQKVRGLLRS